MGKGVVDVLPIGAVVRVLHEGEGPLAPRLLALVRVLGELGLVVIPMLALDLRGDGRLEFDGGEPVHALNTRSPEPSSPSFSFSSSPSSSSSSSSSSASSSSSSSSSGTHANREFREDA